MGCCGGEDDEVPVEARLPLDLLEPLNSLHQETLLSNFIISPINSNFSALLCEDTLRAILEKLPLADLSRAACVCRLWRSVASDRDLQVCVFKSIWKLRDVIGNPSSGGFWRDNSISKFAVSHRLSHGDSIANLAVKYSVQLLSWMASFLFSRFHYVLWSCASARGD